MNFGKPPHEYDPRTIQIGSLIRRDIRAPSNFDFDKGRSPIHLNAWGSKKYKNDVLAAQANYVMRRGRLIEKRNVPLIEQDVIERYKRMTRALWAKDDRDVGVSVLQAMKYWRKNGWPPSNKYNILAYGELDPLDPRQLRKAAYVLTGIFIGFWLPLAVADNYLAWDYNGENGWEWKAGELGGFLAYTKAYNPEGFQILAWDKEIWVSNAFIEKYCDEAWAVISDLDTLTTQVVDVEKLVLMQRGQPPTI